MPILVNSLNSHLHHHSNPTIHGRASNTIRNLFASHDTDERYADPEIKARVVALYLPLISIVVDALPQLHTFITSKCKAWAGASCVAVFLLTGTNRLR